MSRGGTTVPVNMPENETAKDRVKISNKALPRQYKLCPRRRKDRIGVEYENARKALGPVQGPGTGSSLRLTRGILSKIRPPRAGPISKSKLA